METQAWSPRLQDGAGEVAEAKAAPSVPKAEAEVAASVPKSEAEAVPSALKPEALPASEMALKERADGDAEGSPSAILRLKTLVMGETSDEELREVKEDGYHAEATHEDEKGSPASPTPRALTDDFDALEHKDWI